MENFNIEEIRSGLESALNRSFDTSQGIAIYGAGETAARYRDMFDMKAQNVGYIPIEPVYFIDDTPEKQGTTFLGKPIITYEQAHELCKGYVILVCSGYAKSRKIIFDKLKNDSIMDSDFCGFQEYFFCVHKEKVLTVFDMLDDDLSKASYANAILLRMGKEKINPKLVAADSYFELPVFRTFDAKEIYVDCGAYVGDTIEDYLRTHICFKKIVAFEPERSNFTALTQRVNRLKNEWNLSDDKIELVYGGVGEENYSAGIDAMNNQLKNGVPHSGIRISKMEISEREIIQVYALDDYFADQKISFIKADIE